MINKLRTANLINKNDKISPWIDRKISDDLRKEVEELTSFLSDIHTSIRVRIRALMLGITDQPKCIESKWV